ESSVRCLYGCVRTGGKGMPGEHLVEINELRDRCALPEGHARCGQSDHHSILAERTHKAGRSPVACYGKGSGFGVCSACVRIRAHSIEPRCRPFVETCASHLEQPISPHSILFGECRHTLGQPQIDPRKGSEQPCIETRDIDPSLRYPCKRLRRAGRR